MIYCRPFKAPLGQIIDFHFMIYCRPFKADLLPVFYDQAHVVGRDRHNLHDLQWHMFPGLDLLLCRSSRIPPQRQVGSTTVDDLYF